MTQEIAEYMNISFTRGFLVTDVNSSLADEELQVGDIIIRVDKVEVTRMYDIVAYLEENRKNTVKLIVMRNGEILEEPISWQIGPFPPPPD